ncbi:MAG TPA: carboxypeptidase-like regulatory domain-containing protein [Pyrinomonadaceae bacterium]|nr:carboxypeptidase-like regulatory domain-containing protein [Pyrinomonadaceae bacterium]
MCRALLLLSPLVLAVLLASNSHAQTRPGAAATPTPAVVAGDSRPVGVITGRVIDEGGQPVSNARVSTFRVGGAPAPPAIAQSDEEGKFTLSSLTFGAYLINAFAPGYMLETDATDQSAPRLYHHVGDSVTLRMIRGGVITGKVTDADGRAVVGVFVEAARVRYADGRTVPEGASGRLFQPRPTDDRGIYRIYGLRSGAYIVRAGGRNAFGPFTPYDMNVPTYYPSAPREGASQINVLAGQEMSGIDILYRGEAGHAVSGTVSGTLPANFPASGGVVVALKHVSAGAPEQYFTFMPGSTGFVFDGIADGDYDLLARITGSRDGLTAASAPRRVNVRGKDVGNITLTLAPLGSVSGQLLFDPAPSPEDKTACRAARAPRASESIVGMRRFDAGGETDDGSAFFPRASETAPGDNGEFHLRNLKAGRYQPLVRLPADFYVRAVAFGNSPAKTAPPAPPVAPGKAPPHVKSATPAQTAADPARLWFNLQTGERLSGLRIHVAAGAAGLAGRVAVATDETGATAARIAPSRVHLVPAEREQADNALRYAESHVAADGAFAFANLSPGRYWVLARPAANSPDDSARPLAWDAETRARLRREAETANAVVILAPCQRIGDFVLPNRPK